MEVNWTAHQFRRRAQEKKWKPEWKGEGEALVAHRATFCSNRNFLAQPQVSSHKFEILPIYYNHTATNHDLSLLDWRKYQQAVPYCPDNLNRKRTFSELEMGYGYPIPSQSYTTPYQSLHDNPSTIMSSFHLPSISHQNIPPSPSTATTLAPPSSSNPLYHRHQIPPYPPESSYPPQSSGIYDEARPKILGSVIS